MNILPVIIYLIASIILLLLFNHLNKIIKEPTYNSIIITQIYLLLLSGIFTTYHITPNNNSIFLITLFAFFIKIFYSYYLEENKYQPQGKDLQIDILNLITSYFLNIFFINKVENVFLTTDEIKILLWILIMIYLYTNIKKYSKIEKEKKSFLEKKDGEYIVVMYAKFKNQYGNIVISKYKNLIPLIYTIMIYENYNRPYLLRNLDLFLYKIDRKKRTFGIMQIPSRYPISDEKSIILTIKKLERLYSKENNIKNLIQKYDPKHKKQLFMIYQKIMVFHK